MDTVANHHANSSSAGGQAENRGAQSEELIAQLLNLPRGRSGYALYERIRAHGDLIQSSSGMCVAVSHSLCNEVLRSDAFGAVPTTVSKRALEPLDDGGPIVHPLDDSFASIDPPEHTRLRKIVAPWFTPTAIRQQRVFVEQVANEELDRLDRHGTIDLIGDFAVRMPSRVICELLGMSTDDHNLFVNWGLEFGAIVDGARTADDLHRTRALLTEMARYFTDLCELRAKEPRDDLLTAMVRATAGGEMTQGGLIATCESLLIGGFVTTANIIGNAVVALEGHPEQREKFVTHPDSASTLVEEVLRLVAPAQYSVRITRKPVTLAGHQLALGSPIIALIAGANRDPEVFTNPDQLDLDRSNPGKHLSFAAGIHYCIGAGLARLEGEIGLRALYERFPRLEIDGSIKYCPSRVIRGPMRLPVRTS
jgi:cytochrome P450